jgi:hypothetical protein
MNYEFDRNYYHKECKDLRRERKGSNSAICRFFTLFAVKNKELKNKKNKLLINKQ